MNDLGKYDTPDEIAEAILSAVAQYTTIRIASINSNCNSESMFFKVLDLLKEKGLIDYDDSFIFQP